MISDHKTTTNSFNKYLARSPTTNLILAVDTHSDMASGGLMYGESTQAKHVADLPVVSISKSAMLIPSTNPSVVTGTRESAFR